MNEVYSSELRPPNEAINTKLKEKLCTRVFLFQDNTSIHFALNAKAAKLNSIFAHSAGAVEYSDCTSAEG